MAADKKAKKTELLEEFEALETPESRFARALDRLQPLLHNLATEGRAWQAHGIRVDQVLDLNGIIETAMPDLWPRLVGWLDAAVARGWLLPAAQR